MQKRLFWEYARLEFSSVQKREEAVHDLPVFQADLWAAFFIPLAVQLGVDNTRLPAIFRHYLFSEKLQNRIGTDNMNLSLDNNDHVETVVLLLCTKQSRCPPEKQSAAEIFPK